jgi:hypothetical protein
VNYAEESARINREAQLEERRKLAEVLGVQIPVMPPREPGETDRQYGCRIAWIAKSHCGPPPRPKQPPRKPPTIKPQGYYPPERTVSEQDDPDAERLGGMTADYTSGDEP